MRATALLWGIPITDCPFTCNKLSYSIHLILAGMCMWVYCVYMGILCVCGCTECILCVCGCTVCMWVYYEYVGVLFVPLKGGRGRNNKPWMDAMNLLLPCTYSKQFLRSSPKMYNVIHRVATCGQSECTNHMLHLRSVDWQSLWVTCTESVLLDTELSLANWMTISLNQTRPE